MDIVVGYQGKNHVTASQVGRIIAGMAGEGAYVLDTQNKLAATMQTANQVKVDTGDLVVHGRAATVETPETLTIDSGATGQKRNDLVVARYEKDASTSVESMELAVVKGTAVDYGDPSDPEINEGSILDGDSPVDVPLWRIPIDGLAPGTPVQLFENAPTIDSLRDSLSRTKLELIDADAHVDAWRFGQIVEISYFHLGDEEIWTPGPGQYALVGRLPAGVRPVADSWSGTCSKDDQGRSVRMVAGVNGKIQLVQDGGSSGRTWGDVRGSLVFIMA